MIISIDGYDGTGKTTLAKKLAKKFDFFYMEKPAIYMIMEKNNCTLEEASLILKDKEKQLFSNGNRQEIAEFYCNVLSWLSSHSEKNNIVLDRGLLTTYAVIGFPETEHLFDYYLNKGAFLDGSIYLTAKDETRVKRIFANNPNDPDLKFPLKWRENNLEEYAISRNLNFVKIDTEEITPEEIFEKSILILKIF
ncbi:MAG: AAA family ATPase [Bacilli bacterium]|nr:AAA family ATPase [Bacilli bacterium]